MSVLGATASLQTKFIEGDRAYRGGELRPHFLLETFGLRGSAVAAYVGPCEVATGELVDWEDRLENDFIRSARMLHFQGEFFGMQALEAPLLQRLWVAAARDVLQSRFPDEAFERRGDDLFVRGGKLSVSIVTATPVSWLLHLGLNLDPAGAPVRASGLGELGVRGVAAERELAEGLLQAFRDELDGVHWAAVKVMPRSGVGGG